ncbi:MAG: undecaprenyl-diphosphate phosphatase [Armatimonadetes bacterium]|nr:undecaprenyl-diphosphate phosphatase [Armatimonadota bacterium]
MNMAQALILAFIQGATEFLPVSSSGHMALGGKLVGLPQAPLDFVVATHFGTLLAVLVHYRQDLLAMVRAIIRPRGDDPEGGDTPSPADYRRLFGNLILASIPAAIAGVLLEDRIDAAFGDIRLVGLALIVTATLLAVGSRRSGPVDLPETTWKHALWVGVCQAIALVPGISRSGSTIAGGLLGGFSRQWAPRFAFLMSVPVVLGGTFFEARKLFSGGMEANFDPVIYGIATLVAGVVGYLSILLVIDSVRRGNLLYYGAYCLAVGLVAIATGFFVTP